MYGCPPEVAPAPTLSPATSADLHFLAGYARKQVEVCNLAMPRNSGTQLTRHFTMQRAQWERLQRLAEAELLGAKLIVRHEVQPNLRDPASWLRAANTRTFWAGALAGLGMAALLLVMP